MTWHEKSIPETVGFFKTDIRHGLSEAEVKNRHSVYGTNELRTKKKDGFLRHFLAQFQDFMILVLLCAALVSFLTSYLNGETDFLDPIMILCIVVFNAILGVVQENRAERSLEALQKLSAPTARVRRADKICTIPASEIVPGDILILSSGDRIPADCRLFSASGLMTDESSLTGESTGVSKCADILIPADAPLAERQNLCFASTMVIGGKAEAITISTGMQTEVGRIADMILTADAKETPLQKKLSEIGKNLGILALFICAIIFCIGLSRGSEPFEMFLTAVSLAVAAIPEGLPAIVTVMLSIGVQRMVQHNAIIRNLPSVETLGCASVICSDKTGTLTQNKMTVTMVTGTDSDLTLRLAALCCDTEERAKNPTETAILERAKESGIEKKLLDTHHPRHSELPFDSRRKRMTTVHRWNTEFRSITKGAPDVLLERSRFYLQNNTVLPLDADIRRKILAENEQMTNEALRVIGVAYIDHSAPSPCEDGLIFVGLIGMKDPPRPEVAAAVHTCKRAGITPVMITGDHANTAAAIARQVGILSRTKKILTGAELEHLPQSELEQKIRDYAVFARVTPEHKVRIVKAWQKQGAIVAMTGDGVNDAPALRCADIGCSMGKGGCDVAKSASDMVLTDDNFATIVEAVRQGRGIFANIKKAIRFLLSSNIGEILTILFGLLFGWQTPLLAIQLLWVNLVTDSLPAIALGLDPPDRYLMQEAPRPVKKGIFANGLWLSILLEGGIIGTLSLLAFSLGHRLFDYSATPYIGRTMAFCVLSLSQLVHAFNMRSEHSVFSVGFFSNPYLVGAFLLCTILQVGVVSFPPLAALFRVVPLNAMQWLIVALLSAAPLVLIELQKLLSARRDRTN